MFELRIGVSAEDGLGQTFRLVTQGIDIIAHLTIAKDNSHAATFVSLGLTEDTDACTVFLQSLIQVIVEQ